MRGQPGHYTRPYDRLSPSFLGIDDLAAKRSFDSHATRVTDVLGLYFDMLSMDVCTTKHLQTSGRLVQELNVCTVRAPVI